MKNIIKKFLVFSMVVFMALVGTTSCKSSGNLSKKEYKARVEQATKDLTAIINGTTQWSCDEQQARLDQIKQTDFTKKNPEIVEMIDRAQTIISECKAEQARIAEEQRLAEERRLRELEERNKPQTGIEDYLEQIANSNDVNRANKIIKEALKLFCSPDAPVLILINDFGDYDRPTTAVNYLNYIKDQKKVGVKVNNVKMEKGKISELELKVIK